MMTEPSSVRAGDTWVWTYTDPLYADYTLTYYLRNSKSKIDILATASGTEYSVSVDATTTAGYRPGSYSWISRASGADGVFTRSEGLIEVRPNLGASTTQDVRSIAKRMLDNVEAYLVDPNNVAAASYSIGGRSLSRWSRSELLAERDKLKMEVRSEDAAVRIDQGLGNPRRLFVRFDRA